MRLTLLLPALFISACASTPSEPPRLGSVDHGIYSDPAGRFRCPLPSRPDGFQGPVKVMDAIARAGEKGSAYAPAAVVRFLDPLDPARRIEIQAEILEGDTLSEFEARGKQAALYAEGFEAPRHALVSRGVTSSLRYPVSYALLLYPYAEDSVQAEPFEVRGIANLAVPQVDGSVRHVRIVSAHPAGEFLSPSVDATRAEAVLNALRRDRKGIETIRGHLYDVVRACDWRVQTVQVTSN